MKTKFAILIILSLFLPLIIYSCSNTGYEIEIIEDNDTSNSTVKEEKSAGKQIEQPTNANEQVKNEANETYKTYTIQIGAFSNTEFAKTYTENARNILNFDINNTLDGGLYKIRTGSFNNLNDAALILEKIKSLGYIDSFITVSK